MKKQSEKKSKFLSGALIGAALGVAAGIFATSKKGKEISKEAKVKIAEFYKFIAPQIKKAKEMGEEETAGLAVKKTGTDAVEEEWEEEWDEKGSEVEEL